jgi:hypothetical protein
VKTFIPLAAMAVVLTWAAANPDQAIDGARTAGRYVKSLPHKRVDVSEWKRFDDPFARHDWAFERYELYQAEIRDLLRRAQGGQDADAMYTVGTWHLGSQQYPNFGERDPEIGKQMLRQAASLGHSMAAFMIWEMDDLTTPTLRRISGEWTGEFDNRAAIELAMRARNACDLRLMEEALDALTPYAGKLPFTYPVGPGAAAARANLWKHDLVVSLQDLALFRRYYMQRCT